MQRPMRSLRRFSSLAAAAALFLVPACSTRTLNDAVSIAASPTPTTLTRVLGRRAVDYAANPASLERDLKSVSDALDKLFHVLRGKAEDKWGKDGAQVPSAKRYVKYLDNYKSRTLVDFEDGSVTVETVDQDKPRQSLREAVVVTLLTPRDPRSVDLFSDHPVKLGEEPYLLGLVKDQDDRDIRWEWRAGRFADWLMDHSLSERTITRNGKPVTVRSVRIAMVPGHLERSAEKILPLVERQADAYGLDKTLILSIIRVESDFNPFAVSEAGAFGLMQVVPGTAGRDVYQFLHNRPGFPTGAELQDPATNIRYGAAYLHLLVSKYVGPVADPISAEYCAIAAYNGGPGSVLRTFSSDRDEALSRINAMPPDHVYDTLTEDHPAAETRRYLQKVVMARREFRGI